MRVKNKNALNHEIRGVFEFYFLMRKAKYTFIDNSFITGLT